MEVQLYSDVTLSFRYLKSSVPQTGKSVTVIVKDAKTGATILASQSMTEVSTGLYVYNWTGDALTPKQCLATYTVDGKQYDEFFEIENENDVVETNSGKSA